MPHSTCFSCAFGHTRFQPGLEILKKYGDQPVKKTRNNQRLHALEILPADLYGSEEELPHAQKVHQGRVFEHGDKLIAGGGDNEAHCLGQNHALHQLAIGHSQGMGRLDLTPTDRLDAGPEYLGHISPHS